jgi:site-specific DNA recombinase
MVVRVAKYTRRSTDDENQPHSIEVQDTRLDAYVTSQEDWTVVRSYTDDKSGATLDRPGIQHALREAKLGVYDLLLVYRVDRLTRSIKGLIQIVDHLDAAGVAFRSASEHFDTQSPVGRMTMQLLAVFAEYERAIIIDRVVAGMERAAARGSWSGGAHPFGYTSDPRTSYLLPDEHAPLVAIMFDLYGQKRLGARSIANWLNEQGYRTTRGRPWSHEAVLTVLRNRTYLGEIHFRGIWYPAPHQPLVGNALFDLVQQILTMRGEDHSKRRTNSSDYLLAGLVICDRCGKRYLGNIAHGRSRTYRYYTCFSRHRFGTTTCPAERLPADALEAAVLDALLATYNRSDLLTLAVATLRRRATSLAGTHQAELATVRADLRRTHDAIARYLQAFEKQTLPEDVCAARVQSLRDQLTKLQTRQADLKHQLAAAHATPPDPGLLDELKAQVRYAMTSGTASTRKALLRELVAEIRVEDRHTIRPWFWVPDGTRTTNRQVAPQNAVRNLADRVAPTGFEPALPP